MSNDSYIPLKQAQISISKFNDVGIPHHLGLLKNHKSNIEKNLALGDWDKVKKEEINATRVVRQLKNLMLEMDVLRSRISEEEVDKFDELTMIGRKKAIDSIREYLAIQLKTPSTKSSNQNSFDDYEPHELENTTIPQIQTEYELSEHQLRSRQACLAEFENLQREIEDIHQMFHTLHGTVDEQAENVTAVAENVEDAAINVEQGEKQLKQALTYKKAMYPLCGAALGFCIAGPVGLVTFGLKAGSIAAVSCGILGASGGVVIKNQEIKGASDDRKEE